MGSASQCTLGLWEDITGWHGKFREISLINNKHCFHVISISSGQQKKVHVCHRRHLQWTTLLKVDLK